MGWQPGGLGPAENSGFGQRSRNFSRSQQTPGIWTGLELPRVLQTMCPFFGLHIHLFLTCSFQNKARETFFLQAALDRSSGVMCAAEFAMSASTLETTGQGGAEVPIWVWLKTVGEALAVRVSAPPVQQQEQAPKIS